MKNSAKREKNFLEKIQKEKKKSKKKKKVKRKKRRNQKLAIERFSLKIKL